jgi:hypothetical protein
VEFGKNTGKEGTHKAQPQFYYCNVIRMKLHCSWKRFEQHVSTHIFPVLCFCIRIEIVNRNSAVNIATRIRTGWMILQKKENFLYSKSSIQAIGPAQRFIRWVTGFLTGSKAAGAFCWQLTPVQSCYSYLLPPICPMYTVTIFPNFLIEILN